jgi:hypothetical protein
MELRRLCPWRLDRHRRAPNGSLAGRALRPAFHGCQHLINAVPDGYTLLVATVSNAVSATLYEKLKFNFIRDIAPVSSITRGNPLRSTA